MSNLFQRYASYTFCLMLALSLIAAPALAAKDAKSARDASRHSKNAAEVFNESMGAPDKGIPQPVDTYPQTLSRY